MNIVGETWMWWAGAFAVGVPVLLVALTEILGHLTRRKNPAAGPVRLVRNWVVPVGALLALLAFAIQSPADQVWIRVVATIFGFLVILLILSAFNVALFANAKSGSWRERVPTIFVEIVRLLLVVIGLALLFSWVWGADVGGLIAALGVTSIIIGLALQNAVGGVVSGLLLLFEQPFKIGDVLDVGSGVRGRVVEVNWRAVHLDTGGGIEVIPNSKLSGASFTNLSQPPGPYYVSTTVKFTTDDPPDEVTALLVDVADSLLMRVPGERATASYSGAATYTASIPIGSPGEAGRTLTLYLSWLWYAARRRGLALDGDATDPITEPARMEEALDALAPVLHLTDTDRERVRAASRLMRFGKGEIVLPAGVTPDEVFIVVSGRAVLSVPTGDGQFEFATTEAGEIIGHTALTREQSQALTTAVDVLTVLAVPLETIDELVRARPTLAAEIGASLDAKRQQAQQALAAAGIARGVLQLNR